MLVSIIIVNVGLQLLAGGSEGGGEVESVSVATRVAGPGTSSTRTATAGPSSQPMSAIPSFGGWTVGSRSGGGAPGRSYSIFLEDLVGSGEVLLDDGASLVTLEAARIEVHSILQRENGEIRFLDGLVRNRRHLGRRLLERLDERIAEMDGTLFSELSDDDAVGAGEGSRSVSGN